MPRLGTHAERSTNAIAPSVEWPSQIHSASASEATAANVARVRARWARLPANNTSNAAGRRNRSQYSEHRSHRRTCPVAAPTTNADPASAALPGPRRGDSPARAPPATMRACRRPSQALHSPCQKPHRSIANRLTCWPIRGRGSLAQLSRQFHPTRAGRANRKA